MKITVQRLKNLGACSAGIDYVREQGGSVGITKEWTKTLRTDWLIWLMRRDAMYCKALIKAGADVNAKDNDDQTALMWAACYGHTACVDVLIKAGADVSAKVNDVLTALMWAARYGHTACVEVLIKAGADVNVKANDGWTALMRAACCGHTACVDVLKAAGAK